MSTARSPRWILSFADLALILLAFFVLLHARADGRAAVASVREAFGGQAPAPVLDLPAEALFQPGEAVLRPGAAERLRAIGARSAGKATVRIAARGEEAAAARLDGWELTAARLAAIGRGLGAGGLKAQAIVLDLPGTAAARAGAPRFRIGGA